jgi:hypothetical protein
MAKHGETNVMQHSSNMPLMSYGCYGCYGFLFGLARHVQDHPESSRHFQGIFESTLSSKSSKLVKSRLLGNGSHGVPA